MNLLRIAKKLMANVTIQVDSFKKSTNQADTDVSIMFPNGKEPSFSENFLKALSESLNMSLEEAREAFSPAWELNVGVNLFWNTEENQVDWRLNDIEGYVLSESTIAQLDQKCDFSKIMERQMSFVVSDPALVEDMKPRTGR